MTNSDEKNVYAVLAALSSLSAPLKSEKGFKRRVSIVRVETSEDVNAVTFITENEEAQ